MARADVHANSTILSRDFEEIDPVNKFVKIAALCFAVVLVACAGHGPGRRLAGRRPVDADQPRRRVRRRPGDPRRRATASARSAAAAVESMARQPEVAGNIQTAMIIAAALIEGVTFFALIVCMLFNTVS